MKYVLGALLGLLWGTAAALINAKISRKALEKGSAGALQAASAGRLAVDIAALGLVYLLRNVLPFSYEVMLVATAIAMSLMTIVLAFRMSKTEKGKTEPKD